VQPDPLTTGASHVHDLAIIIVSANSARWLRPALSSVFAHAGDITLDVVVADNESKDETREIVEAEFPAARVVRCRNRGFAHGNNRALMTCNARYILFLNPDTEILVGSFAELLRLLDVRPEVGLVGVRQVTPDGELFPTMRRFPSALRALRDAIPERTALLSSWGGERELRMDRYSQEMSCDWVSGSFMLVRREAVESAGFMDERSFLYSEEPDLCFRIKQAGWDVRHLPAMTILHHSDKAGINDRMLAQDAFSRIQYARKHFSTGSRFAYTLALGLRYALRAVAATDDPEITERRRRANRRAIRVLLGRETSPFGDPPGQAVALRSVSVGCREEEKPPVTGA
jgi:N-acetylglucosaminyl-diphospho-decaprenol L-rhamnosyltransferase